MNAHGVAVDATKVHDCANGATYAWDVTVVIAGSQSSNGNTIVASCPTAWPSRSSRWRYGL